MKVCSMATTSFGNSRKVFLVTLFFSSTNVHNRPLPKEQCRRTPSYNAKIWKKKIIWCTRPGGFPIYWAGGHTGSAWARKSETWLRTLLSLFLDSSCDTSFAKSVYSWERRESHDQNDSCAAEISEPVATAYDVFSLRNLSSCLLFFCLPYVDWLIWRSVRSHMNLPE